MRNLLAYNTHSDQEIYLEAKIGGSTVKAATIAGYPEKPNEDAFAATEVFFGVFDGTTSAPIPALGKTSSARYASHFIIEHFIDIPQQATPKEALLFLNEKLWKTVEPLEGVTLSDTLTLPASTATIMKVHDKTFSFAHIGDSFGIAYFEDGHSAMFTDDKNHTFDERMFTLIRELALKKNISNREARQDPRINEALYKMYYERNNHPSGKGSGLVNGDPHLKKYIQTGEISLRGLTEILLGTDGLIPQGWSLQKEADRKKLIDEIHEGGFRKLFITKQQSEEDDQIWEHIRYKDSDDATGILINF